MITRKFIVYNSRGHEVFTFTTSVTKHGATLIDIPNTIEVARVTVTYPAQINGINGYITFEQPIKNPFVSIIDQHIVEMTGTLFADNYYHLTFNGPEFWEVNINDDVVEGTNIDVGSLVTPNQLISMRPVFSYDPLPNSAKNIKDLEELKSRVLRELL